MSIRMKRNGLGLFLLAVLFVAVAFTWSVPAVHAETIKEKIVTSQGTGGVTKLEEQVDDSTQNVVSTARKIAIPLTVIFGLWLAVCYFRAGFSPDSLRETKGRIFFFIIFLALSFWTESILGTIFSFFGIDLSKL
ncbi:hypothetical protein D3C81_1087230 [compost metagenome]